jgi:hypothetical protein
LAVGGRVPEDEHVIEVRPGGRRRIDRVLAPDYVRDLGQLDLAEVRGRRDDAAQEETDLSYLRRLLHGRIDIVKAEQKRRREGGSSSVVERLAEILSDNVVGATPSGSGRHQPLEPSRAEAHRRHVEALVSDADLTDVSSLPDERLDLALRTYAAEEASVSKRRREVQKVVDALNDEIGARYKAGSASVDTLLAAERGDDESR